MFKKQKWSFVLRKNPIRQLHGQFENTIRNLREEFLADNNNVNEIVMEENDDKQVDGGTEEENNSDKSDGEKLAQENDEKMNTEENSDGDEEEENCEENEEEEEEFETEGEENDDLEDDEEFELKCKAQRIRARCPYPNCRKVLTRKYMKKHIRIKHTREGLTKCSYCPQSCLNQCHLRKHIIAVHSGTKPFKCNFCGKQFGYKSINGAKITTSPAPPLVERIEIRLVDVENTTEETPLIIVDVVKKNNGSGVAATIQQHHGENLELNKPSQGFLVRLKQPNYHSVSYIPYGTTTTEMPEISTTEVIKEIETENLPKETDESILPITTISSRMPESMDEIDKNILKEEGDKTRVNDSEMALALATTTEENAGLGEMVQIVPIDKIEEQKGQKMETIEKEENEEKIGEIDEEKMEEINIGEEENVEELSENMKNMLIEKEKKIVDEEDDEDEERTEKLLNSENAKIFNESEFGSLNGGNDDTNLSKTLEFGYDLRGENEVEEIVGGEEGINNENGEKTNEECLANKENLREEVIKRLIAERRRIVQAIKKINKHQMLLCRPNRDQNQVPYRKCPMWRREKFFLYYALMRITYCGNHARWPGGRRFRAV